MSEPTKKPHSEDPPPNGTIPPNVALSRLAHEAAASAREKTIPPMGQAPIALWLLVGVTFIGTVAGVILSRSCGQMFDYQSSFQENYKRTSPKGPGTGGPAPKEALAAYSAKGAKLFSAKCSGCHGPDGKGDGTNYPSLAGSAFAIGESERLEMIILNGLTGPTSNGKTFGAGLMPPQGAGMTQEDLAVLMTYVRNGLGNKTGDIITPEMAKAGMDASLARKNAGQPVTAAELNAVHKKPLPGVIMDPHSMVNPITLQPATGAAKP